MSPLPGSRRKSDRQEIPSELSFFVSVPIETALGNPCQGAILLPVQPEVEFLAVSKIKVVRGLTKPALYSAFRTRSLSFMPRADAKALATSIPTLTLPSSIELMYVRCMFARSANFS
jgi:hypothetical protein